MGAEVQNACSWENAMQRAGAISVALVILLLIAPAPGQPAKADDHAKTLKAARDKGLDWLTKNQAANGSWGKDHSIAVTSFASPPSD